MAHFSHAVDGRVYSVRVGEDCAHRRYNSRAKPYRYACLEPHPSHPDLLISVLDDHTIGMPSELVTTLVVIDIVMKELRPLLSGQIFMPQQKYRLTEKSWHGFRGHIQICIGKAARFTLTISILTRTTYSQLSVANITQGAFLMIGECILSSYIHHNQPKNRTWTAV
ncbi:hypothetical protein BJ912DRAFT_669430 [Pholiota molesta]|nr:hypothetical protein BJ912DRAFT_669430 [Pholiota molesta]